MTFDAGCVLVSRLPGIADAVQQQSAVPCLHMRDATWFLRMLESSGMPLTCIYIEDLCGTAEEVWQIVQFAGKHSIPIALCMVSWGLGQRHDFEQAGVAVWGGQDTSALPAWILATLSLPTKKSVGASAMLAIAGSKGGIGKSLTTSLLAVGLARRGARVLVIDGDISNSGIASTFRISSSAPSYLSIKQYGAGAWTPERVRTCVWKHPETGIDFLLASDDVDSEDLWLHEWQSMMQAVRDMGGYDILLTDTSPDIRKRPYALDVAMHAGYLLFPTPIGYDDRMGVGKTLESFRKRDADALARCMLLFIHPEAPSAITVGEVRPKFEQMFPKAHVVGELHRAAWQISTAREKYEQFVSPIDIAPHSVFTQDVHNMVERVCEVMHVNTPLPKPKSTLWQRLRNRPADSVDVQPVEREVLREPDFRHEHEQAW